MTVQQLNYDRIAAAIRFIKENRREQPKLEEVAEHVHMTPYHFQRTLYILIENSTTILN